MRAFSRRKPGCMRVNYTVGFHASKRCLAIKPLRMPALSPTMTEGTLTKWAKQEGDTFEAGEILFEVETDKAQIEVEAQDDGRIAKIVQAAGDGKVSVNATIAYLTDDPDEDVSNFTPPSSDAETKRAQPAPPATSPPSPNVVKLDAPSVSSTVAIDFSGRHLSPAVAVLVHNHGLSENDLTKIPASGPKGRILKGDVLNWLEAGKLTSTATASASKKESTSASKKPTVQSGVGRRVIQPAYQPVITSRDALLQTLGADMKMLDFLAGKVPLNTGAPAELQHQQSASQSGGSDADLLKLLMDKL